MKGNEKNLRQTAARQTDLSPDRKCFNMHCAICMKTYGQKKKAWRRQKVQLLKLRANFNYCPTCRRWLCSDCFWVDDGQGGIGICAECGLAQGIKGYTSAQINRLIWPTGQRTAKEGGH
jgi:hypothetical protein